MLPCSSSGASIVLDPAPTNRLWARVTFCAPFATRRNTAPLGRSLTIVLKAMRSAVVRPAVAFGTEGNKGRVFGRRPLLDEIPDHFGLPSVRKLKFVARSSVFAGQPTVADTVDPGTALEQMPDVGACKQAAFDVEPGDGAYIEIVGLAAWMTVPFEGRRIDRNLHRFKIAGEDAVFVVGEDALRNGNGTVLNADARAVAVADASSAKLDVFEFEPACHEPP